MVRRIEFVPAIMLGAALLIASSGSTEAQDKVVSVSTLDWPPYTGSKRPEGGVTTEVVRAAFAKVGYQVEVAYRSCKRAINMADAGTDGVVAYFPGYHSHHREDFLASEPIGTGPLGFADQRANFLGKSRRHWRAAARDWHGP